MTQPVIADSADLEVWKDIPGWKGFYQASSHGRIKSLERKRPNGTNSVGVFKERIMQQSLNKWGYLQVRLAHKRCGRTIKVHKLIAMTFLGHTPCGIKDVIDHLDNVKTNNYASNLVITTSRCNNSKDRTNRTGLTGVQITEKGAITAGIKIKGKSYSLGTFGTLEGASAEYNRVAKLADNGFIPPRRRTNRTGFTGVSFHQNKFRTILHKDGIKFDEGCFNTAIEAAVAYDKKAVELYGHKANTNFLIENYL